MELDGLEGEDNFLTTLISRIQKLGNSSMTRGSTQVDFEIEDEARWCNFTIHFENNNI